MYVRALHGAVVPSSPTGKLIYMSGSGTGRPAFLNQRVDVYKNMRWNDVSPVVATSSITIGAEGKNAITFTALLLAKRHFIPLEREVAFQIRGIKRPFFDFS